MRLRIPLIILPLVAFTWAAQDTQAGLIRAASERITRVSTRVASAVGAGGQAMAGGAAAAGGATGHAVKTGAVDVGRGAKAAPGAVHRGTQAVAKGIWKAIW